MARKDLRLLDGDLWISERKSLPVEDSPSSARQNLPEWSFLPTGDTCRHAGKSAVEAMM
jgi:hypothetical protein